MVTSPDLVAVKVCVLGPLDMTVDGRPVVLTSGRLRTLLAALALAAGSSVTVERLARTLWHDDLPNDVRRVVQTYIGRLRTAMGVEAIATEPEGYRLRIDPDQVDVLRFSRLLRKASLSGDTAVERALLGEALALWRGDPFDGLPSDWLARYEAPRLVEKHLAATERRIDLDLGDGRHGEVVAELRELTVRHPLRESLWARLLIALDRSGRRAEALVQYEAIRRRFAEELGAEPGPELRRLHAVLLTVEASPSAKVHAGGRDLPVVPRQLPRDLDGFAGRTDILARLDSLLDARRSGGAPWTIAIAGTAGVGKTTLAVHWAHRVANRFPDGQLYVDLRGFDPSGRPMSPTDAIRGFLAALGVSAERVPPDLDGQIGLYRSVLAGRRTLVVLDNARDGGQVRPLLPASPTCVVVVTSRDRLTSLIATEGVRPVGVDLLTAEEASQLLSVRLGGARTAAEPVAVAEIIDRCARLPLALAVAAAHAAIRPTFSLSVLAEQLRAEPTRLDALTTGEPSTDARAVFSWSYRALSPAAAGLFRLLGLSPGPDISATAAASLAGLSAGRIRPLLAELCSAHLVTEHEVGRYTFHDLLRAYAVELVATHDSGQVKEAARRRLMDHYVSTAAAAAAILNPRHEPSVVGDPAPGVRPEPVTSSEEALAWFAAEHQPLLAAITEAAATGFDSHAWQLAWAVRLFLHRRGFWHSLLTTQHTALAAAQRLGDRRSQAHSHRFVAAAFGNLGRDTDSGRHLENALDLYRELGDLVGQAQSRLNLGHLADRQDRTDDALRHAQQALECFTAAGHRAGEGLALNAIGYSYAKRGDYQAALHHCERAIAIADELADRSGQASTWDSLGYAHHRLGNGQEAVRCYRRAVALYAELGNRFLQARSLGALAEAHLAMSEVEPARAIWRQASTILDELDHPDAEAVRTRLSAVTASGADLR